MCDKSSKNSKNDHEQKFAYVIIHGLKQYCRVIVFSMSLHDCGTLFHTYKRPAKQYERVLLILLLIDWIIPIKLGLNGLTVVQFRQLKIWIRD